MTAGHDTGPAIVGRDWAGWRTVVWLGVVSLLADLVYEGARSITGPFLASLGASALAVGLVTGAGEAAALGFRLFSGPAADRTGRYWSWTITGYGMTALCVPLMALAPALGAAGLVFGSAMVLLERTGKAVRSPAKSTLLAIAARDVGRGRGFGVHKALDQTGAFAGPLIVAGVVALTAHTWPGLAVLAIPGAATMLLLGWIRRHVPDPPRRRPPDVLAGGVEERLEALPRTFHVFALACALTTLGLMTFGVISFHLVHEHLLAAALVPVVYAVAMAAEAIAALGTGFAYDRVGGATLIVLPPLVAAVPLLVFTDRVAIVVAGLLLWGAATGVQDSTVKALVADLVPSTRLATAYGAFAAFQAVAALAGGGLAGLLYAAHRGWLVAGIGVSQVVALALLGCVLIGPGRGRAPAR